MSGGCPEQAYRTALTDSAFWEYVLPPLARYDPDPDDGGPDLGIQTGQDEPCPECGEHGACAWDSEGRPLVHAIAAEDES